MLLEHASSLQEEGLKNKSALWRCATCLGSPIYTGHTGRIAENSLFQPHFVVLFKESSLWRHCLAYWEHGSKRARLAPLWIRSAAEQGMQDLMLSLRGVLMLSSYAWAIGRPARSCDCTAPRSAQQSEHQIVQAEPTGGQDKASN